MYLHTYNTYVFIYVYMLYLSIHIYVVFIYIYIYMLYLYIYICCIYICRFRPDRNVVALPVDLSRITCPIGCVEFSGNTDRPKEADSNLIIKVCL